MATATSDVAICNLALQLLGARRVTSLTEDSPNARSMNSCYTMLRDSELEKHPWRFAMSRAQLAASPIKPAFHFANAFPLPADNLTLILPRWRIALDWVIENHEGQPSILTNDAAPLNINYVAQIADPTLFPTSFCRALAAALAAHTCEEITQSNEKKADAQGRYKEAIGEAKQNNAFMVVPPEGPVDTWDAARVMPGAGERNWLSFG